MPCNQGDVERIHFHDAGNMFSAAVNALDQRPTGRLVIIGMMSANRVILRFAYLGKTGLDQACNPLSPFLSHFPPPFESPLIP